MGKMTSSGIQRALQNEFHAALRKKTNPTHAPHYNLFQSIVN
jgi:hypothetical protein